MKLGTVRIKLFKAVGKIAGDTIQLKGERYWNIQRARCLNKKKLNVSVIGMFSAPAASRRERE